MIPGIDEKGILTEARIAQLLGKAKKQKMPRNEYQTCWEIIEPALQQVSWGFDGAVEICLGRVNLSGEQMCVLNQKIIAVMCCGSGRCH